MKLEEVKTALKELSSPVETTSGSLGIILAAGHGKRIKSEKSKMLHEIWGEPTVVRVSRALREGLDSSGQIIVVGIKAEDVAGTVGKRKGTGYVLQEEQKGTGDAVRTAMKLLGTGDLDGNVYVVPGDIGLIDAKTVRGFKETFESSDADMMVLTGCFSGDAAENYYGRILRVPATDVNGADTGETAGEVIEIKEHKDVLALGEDEEYRIRHKGMEFKFPKGQLVNLREFNTGIFGFKASALAEHIRDITTDNVQGELYVTDLIRIFNENGRKVAATQAPDDRLVEGFNVKSVLREMENIAREKVYDLLKDVVAIEDKHDFYIADNTVKRLLKLDEQGKAGDIFFGKGAFIGADVSFSGSTHVGAGARLEGTLGLGAGVILGDRVCTSCFPGQKITVGDGTEIMSGNEIKGEVKIGARCTLERRVSVTGSDEYPAKIGNEVWIRGVTYIFGSIIEDGTAITHCVLKRKRVERWVDENGKTRKIRYFIPDAEGEQQIKSIKESGDDE